MSIRGRQPECRFWGVVDKLTHELVFGSSVDDFIAEEYQNCEEKGQKECRATKFKEEPNVRDFRVVISKPHPNGQTTKEEVEPKESEPEAKPSPIAPNQECPPSVEWILPCCKGENDETHQGHCGEVSRQSCRSPSLSVIPSFPFSVEIHNQRTGREENKGNEKQVVRFYPRNYERLEDVNCDEHYRPFNGIPNQFPIEIPRGVSQCISFPRVDQSSRVSNGETKQTIDRGKIWSERIEVGWETRHRSEGEPKDYKKQDSTKWGKVKVALSRTILLATSMLIAYFVAEYIGGQAQSAGYDSNTVFFIRVGTFLAFAFIGFFITRSDEVEI
jgi:hypothetical protein